jgi:hypothetical protein
MQCDSPDATTAAATSNGPRFGELAAVLGLWVALAALLFCLAAENTLLPGLYYDEAIFGGLAKDFVAGTPHGQHLATAVVVNVFGHPFPLFVQSYLGAFKSWLLIPPIALFGATVPVLRLTNLAMSVAGLLFFMLWTWRMAGLRVALAAGPLLALDPAFFFTSILDWGAAAPSLLCRFAGFYFAVRVWERGKVRDALLAGVFLGLGLFNKIDFVVILLGVTLGAAVALGPDLAAFAARRGRVLVWGSLAFLIGGGMLMLTQIPNILSQHQLVRRGELNEKMHILQTMWDGSYFYRLMAAGGRFDALYKVAPATWTPFALVFAASTAVLGAGMLRRGAQDEARQLPTFLLLTTLLLTVGFLLLPGANRLHHALAVMPFPHLIIASALVIGWRKCGNSRIGRALLAACFAALIGWQALDIVRTQRLIRDTGGRGWWSASMDQFCREVKNRSDLTIISLDWGFNEQLLYLTSGPRLVEPIWKWIANPDVDLSKPPGDENFVFLFHPDTYSQTAYGSNFIRYAPPPGKSLSIQAWCDAEGRPAFYSARFVKKKPAP